MQLLVLTGVDGFGVFSVFTVFRAALRAKDYCPLG